MEINDSIRVLKGVGEKTGLLLESLGIFTLLDLLLYFPRAYDTFREAEESYFNGQDKLKLSATLLKKTRPIRTGGGRTLTTLTFDTEYGPLKAMYFNMPYIGNAFQVGENYRLTGKFLRKGKNLETVNPALLREDVEIIPVYPLSKGVTNHLLRRLLTQVLERVIFNENLPSSILQEEGLVPLDEAVRNLHFPADEEKLRQALTRMRFQEMFAYSMKILLARSLRDASTAGQVFRMSPRLAQLKEAIPFQLTPAQNRVIREILQDQKKSAPMNRLLQGDVGSGKTIVALITLFNVVENGCQGAFMAPTEILAKQHYKEAVRLLSPFGVEIEELTGSTKKKDRERILQALREGKPMIVVGTHALIEEDVEFSHLGMIVTDEQHRFGVNQRARLRNKSQEAEVLVMSATPIPRTMALTLYADLDLSVIDEMPRDRKIIETELLDARERDKCYRKVREEVAKGRQAYVVTPLIDLDEEGELNSVMGLYEELSKGELKGIRLGVLHGKMTSKEKDRVMGEFSQGELQVLIATTVIEVGVNVPNASVMVIENAERFGLAQLHQLRGRVGRGAYQSYCIMLAQIRSQTTRERLEIMVKSHDGFFIAEEDLKQRGTGELFGVQQSGNSGLVLSDLTRDYALFQKAHRHARTVYGGTSPEDQRLKAQILDRIQRSLKYISLD